MIRACPAEHEILQCSYIPWHWSRCRNVWKGKKRTSTSSKSRSDAREGCEPTPTGNVHLGGLFGVGKPQCELPSSLVPRSLARGNLCRKSRRPAPSTERKRRSLSNAAITVSLGGRERGTARLRILRAVDRRACVCSRQARTHIWVHKTQYNVRRLDASHALRNDLSPNCPECYGSRSEISAR